MNTGISRKEKIMKIAKFVPDEEGVIRIPKCVAAIWIGMQNDMPVIMCIVGETGEVGKDLTFYVKSVGDPVELSEMKQFTTALVTADAEYFLFGEKPSIIQETAGPGPMTGPATPPGMSGRTFQR
jgi:hypothetical protein